MYTLRPADAGMHGTVLAWRGEALSRRVTGYGFRSVYTLQSQQQQQQQPSLTRSGAVVRKRNHVDIFRRLSTVHERDKQTHHGTATSIAIAEIACQRCRLKSRNVLMYYQVCVA